MRRICLCAELKEEFSRRVLYRLQNLIKILSAIIALVRLSRLARHAYQYILSNVWALSDWGPYLIPGSVTLQGEGVNKEGNQ